MTNPFHPLWRPVDWFLSPDLHDRDPDRLRRSRMLVICIALLIPLMLWAAVALNRVGTLLADQANVLAASTLVLFGCLALLKATRSHVAAGTLFCSYLIWVIFFLALTDYGLLDAALVWAALVPLMAAFVVGPWLAVACAALLIGVVGVVYVLQVQGGYTPPMLSTPQEMVQFSVLGIASAVGFAALLGWVYEVYTVRYLRRVNARLRELRGELEESETRYQSLFEDSPLGVYRSTPEGRVTMANHVLLEMLGVGSLAELDGLDVRTLYKDPEERDRLLRELEQKGEIRGHEYTLVARGGRLFHVRESARAVRNRSGRVSFYEGVIEDVTAQRQAEHAARRTEERYRALVQHSTDTITILDPEGIVRYQSPSIAHNLGYTPEESIGRSVFELVHPEDRQRVEVLFRRGVSRPGELGTVELRCRHAQGHYVYVESAGANMLDNPYVRGIVLNSRDVTDRKRVEVALVKAKEQAEEVAHLKSAFLTNMSHEIRTPLTGIIGFAGVLVEEVGEEQREFARLIEKSGQRLLQTLNSVLDLARLEANQMDVDLQTLPVGEHVAEAVSLLGPLAKERGLVLETRVEAPAAQARLDPTCLNRIVNNLVGNALKFTEEGRVTVSVRTRGAEVVLEVADTGVGIDAAFLPQLFEEFKQESSGVGRKHEGSGLGLTITRRLVELMHGSLEVASKKGVGSTFTARFPLHRTARPVVHVATTSEGRPRVLVMDDNESTLALMERMLRDLADADVVATPEEALALTGEGPGQAYDVLFLDLHLAGTVSGTEVLRQLRARPAYEETPIVAFTAFALPGDRERFLNAGFSGYLGKPFTRDRLYDVLREMLAPEWTMTGEGAAARFTSTRPAAPDAVPDDLLAGATFIGE